MHLRTRACRTNAHAHATFSTEHNDRKLLAFLLLSKVNCRFKQHASSYFMSQDWQCGRFALAQQVAESGAVKKSGPGPLPLPSLMDAADTVPCDGLQPATVLPFWATRAENGFTTCCAPGRETLRMQFSDHACDHPEKCRCQAPFMNNDDHASQNMHSSLSLASLQDSD